MAFDIMDESLLALALALARIGPSLLFLPILNNAALGTGMLRAAVLAVIAAGLLPAIDPGNTLGLPETPLMAIIFKETVLGFALGLVFSAPFHAVYAIGELIDNQRGATISNTIDPTVGVEASPLSSFLTFFWTAVFVSSDGLQKLLSMLVESYRLVPMDQPFLFSLPAVLHIAHALNAALFAGIAAAAPVIVAMLLIEVALGLLSRYAPQLNPFSLSLTVKSIVACLILVFYLRPSLFDQINGLQRLSGAAHLLP